GDVPTLVGRDVVGVDPAAAGDLDPFALRGDGREGLAGREAADLTIAGARTRADAQVRGGAIAAGVGVGVDPRALLVAADVGAGGGAGARADHGAEGALIARHLAAGEAADEGADNGAGLLTAARGVAAGDAVRLLREGGGRQGDRTQSGQQGGRGQSDGDL